MNLRSVGFQVARAAVPLAAMTLATLPSNGQIHSQTNSASQIAAELAKGKLNSADSKPGDTFVIRLQSDLRSNGEVILKKGSTITGVVRNLKGADPKSRVQSMMEVEWLVPSVQARGVRSLSFSLQSVVQLTPSYRREDIDPFADETGIGASVPISTVAARPLRNSGNLLDSVPSPVETSGRSNVALLSMPSVVAVDQETSSAIENVLGASSSGQLFRVGHGEVISAGGFRQSIDLYSHLGNDTVITSPGRNFEISSGAQMQMLVGVNRK
jgi:hypothetical protein